MTTFDEGKIKGEADNLLNSLAQLVTALIDEQKVGVTHSPATRLAIGNAVAIIMRVRSDESDKAKQGDSGHGVGGSGSSGGGKVPGGTDNPVGTKT
jgi:hypothetical protein